MSNPYAAPTTTGDESSSTQVNAGPVRTAALFLVSTGLFAATTWFIERFWEFTPTWQAVLQSSVQVVLGAGLLGFGRRAIPVTFAVLGIALLHRITLHTQVVEHVGPRGLLVPLTLDILNFSPPLLLLLGRPSSIRRRIALVTFLLGRAADLALVVATISILR
jgi:hypothetical protein